VIREELLPEKYIEAKESIRGDPTKAESFRITSLSWIREFYFRTIYIHGMVRSSTPNRSVQDVNLVVHCIAQGKQQNGKIFRGELHRDFLAPSDDVVKAHFLTTFGYRRDSIDRPIRGMAPRPRHAVKELNRAG